MQKMTYSWAIALIAENSKAKVADLCNFGFEVVEIATKEDEPHFTLGQPKVLIHFSELKPTTSSLMKLKNYNVIKLDVTCRETGRTEEIWLNVGLP